MEKEVLPQCPAIRYNPGYAQVILSCFYSCYSIPINKKYNKRIGELHCEDVKCEDCYVKQLYQMVMKNEN